MSDPLISRSREARRERGRLESDERRRPQTPPTRPRRDEWDGKIASSSPSGTDGIREYAIDEVEPDEAQTYRLKANGRHASLALRRFEISAQDTGETVTAVPAGTIVRVWREVLTGGSTRHVFELPESGGGGGSTFTSSFFEITGSTATGINDARSNPVQWTYSVSKVEPGAEVLSAVSGIAWSESAKTLTKTDAFAGYEPNNGDKTVIADTAGIEPGEYQVKSKIDDSTIELFDSITTGSGDETGVELTKIRRFGGYGAWALPEDTADRLFADGFNFYEQDNDGVGRQGNGVDHDGNGYPAGFAMQPIQDGVIVRGEVVDVGGTKEVWFGAPNGEDGTCV